MAGIHSMMKWMTAYSVDSLTKAATSCVEAHPGTQLPLDLYGCPCDAHRCIREQHKQRRHRDGEQATRDEDRRPTESTHRLQIRD
jgi:hypothetical protein